MGIALSTHAPAAAVGHEGHPTEARPASDDDPLRVEPRATGGPPRLVYKSSDDAAVE